MYKLYQEEYLIKDIVDSYNFFLCNLLPNNINIFVLNSIDDNIIEYVRNHFYSFRYLIYPVYKHLWSQKKIFINNNKLICNLDNINLEYYNYNISYLRDIFLNDNLELSLHNNTYDIYIKRLKIYCSFEAYAYLYLQSFKIINEKNLNYLFILGILEASIDIGFCSLPYKQENTSNRFQLFNFSTIPLKSLYVTNQLQIFKAWLLKSDILLTGDTGIGKTSQIPKLFWWINFLYDGFGNNLNFNKFSFNLELISEIKINSTVLSLPRKILITETATNIAKSLGFNTIKNSPINCVFKDVRNTIYHNDNANKYINPFVVSINRITTINKINTLIFDEIHEHDTYADIGITKAKYYKKKNGINNIVLISATVSDDLEDIYKFLPNIHRIHIKGDTLYKITTLDYSNQYNNVIDLIKIINKFSIDIGKSTLIFLPSVSSINKIKESLNKLIKSNIYIILELHRQLLTSKDVLKEITKYPNKHVIILSTPIAESSLTIVNVTTVIDFGLFYCKQFFSGSIMQITDSMMKQRRGRIGRVSRGTYIHLFPLTKLNKMFKKIDYEFLLPYIINCYYFNIKFEDLFILPTDMSRFERTLRYFKQKNVNIIKHISDIYHIYNKYFVTIPEYLIIYLYSNRDIIKILDNFENSNNKIRIIKNNQYFIEKIVKTINIKFNIIKKQDNDYKINLINYYEKMPPIIIKTLKINEGNNNYLIDQSIGIIC